MAMILKKETERYYENVINLICCRIRSQSATNRFEEEEEESSSSDESDEDHKEKVQKKKKR